MSRIDDEILMRRLDGELTPDQAARIDADLARDAAGRARMDAMMHGDRALKAAFPATADARDAALAGLIRGDTARSRAGAGGWRSLFGPRGLAVGMGLAVAGFIGGIALGPVLTGRADPMVGTGGRVSDPALVRVLDRRLAGQGADRDGRSVGLTFRDLDGRWCRTFADDTAGLGGLACRAERGWDAEVLAPLGARQAGDLRMASSDIPPAVLAVVDARMGDVPVSPDREVTARDAGFR